MTAPSFIEPLFRTIDRMDSEAFAAFLAEDGVFRFGNGPAAKGREAASEAVGAFFASISGLRHRILGTWVHPDAIFCQGEVTYTRHDGSAITLPFVNVLRMDGNEKIKEYLVYADITPLFAPLDR